MTLPKSSLRTQILAAGLFVAFAAGFVAYARAFRASADASLAGETGVDPEPTTPLPESLTPQSAQSARELQAALLKTFGNNSRGMSCVTYVDYDAHADRLHITFPLDDAEPNSPGAKRGGLRRMRELLDSIRDGQMQWTWVLMTGTSQARDKAGAASESTVIRAQFLRDRLRKLDWTHLTGDDLPGYAQHYWLYPDLAN